jgi:hypothetical protein
MLEFFKSLFSKKATDGYPEALIKDLIEHAVDSTDPWIRSVSSYKKKMRPAVLRAMNYVSALVDDMPPVTLVKQDSYISDSRLRPFFISSSDMWEVLESCMTSSGFLRGQEGNAPWIYALLTMRKIEKSVLGAEVVGVIVLRDVPQHTVSFESHRLLDPAQREEETRSKLKIRAFDHLLRLAHRRITLVKSERGKLERHREILQSKLNLLTRGAWGFWDATVGKDSGIGDLEVSVAKIEAALSGLDGNDKVLDSYLDVVIDVLGRPDENIWMNKETLIIDRTGVLHSEPNDVTQNVSLDVVCDSNDMSLVALPVAFPGKQCRV